MKRFVLGFLVGIGLMYYYLNYGPTMASGARGWFDSAAAHYRDDQQHRAAREALGESEPPR